MTLPAMTLPVLWYPGVCLVSSCTPHSGYHGVTKVTKNADIAKMAENCICCISGPTPPAQTLWS